MDAITDVNNFDADKVRFMEPKSHHLWRRRELQMTLRSDGSLEPLLFVTDKCFLWGVQDKSQKFKDQKGYELPIVLHNRTPEGVLEPTKHQKNFTKAFNVVVEKCKQHCLLNKDKIGRHDPEPSDLRSIGGCLYLKKVRGGEQTTVSGYPQRLYAKVPFGEKKAEFLINFYEMKNVEDHDEPGKVLDPNDILRERCYVKALVRMENIFVPGSCVRLRKKIDVL